ncbi:Synaptonemal complex protein 2-like [Apodemus speciosus]|uniref:Synaptonemal complex protein 2-like n=1 Tax=Apodemus speciosus TaxID=105296 RepID=A0ABQ0FFU2_APOSI
MCFQNCSLLLKCIQRFFRDDPEQEEPLLIQQGLIPKIIISSVHMVSWFETIMEFLISNVLASEALLTNAMEDFLDTALVISRHSKKGDNPDVGFLHTLFRIPGGRRLHEALHSAGGSEDFELHFERCTPGREKKALFGRRRMPSYYYSQQVALSEALCRMSVGTQRNELADQWFDDAALAGAFKEIKNREFETDCRQFLNFLNNRLGDQRRMRKPADEKLEEFWIDFNLGSQSVTFYIDNAESPLWEPVELSKEAMVNYIITENDRIKMFIVYLKQPIVISKREAKKIEIHFDRQFDISQASVRALGEDKQKDAKESTILPEFVDAEVDRCLITRRFHVQSASAQTRPEDHSPENSKPDEPKQDYEDPVDVQEPSSQNQASELNNTKEDSAFAKDGEQDRMLVKFNYQGAILDPEPQKEISENLLPEEEGLESCSYWILPLSPARSGSAPEKDETELTPLWKGTSRRNDSTLLKISETQLRESSVLLTPEASTQKIELRSLPPPSRPASFEYPEVEEDVPEIVNREPFMGNSSFKHKLGNSEHREVMSARRGGLGNARRAGCGEGCRKTYINTGWCRYSGHTCEVHRQKRTRYTGHKRSAYINGSRQCCLCLEIPDGSVVAVKQSRLEDAPGSPVVTDISTPSQEDVPENANGSAFKTAFENFTRDLKRKFELKLKQKEIPFSSEKAKEVPACLLRLWNQIHMCRLDKLERFHSSVLQELSSLEKDLQTLDSLEKDALARVWERVSADLKSFCDQQVWRNMDEEVCSQEHRHLPGMK